MLLQLQLYISAHYFSSSLVSIDMVQALEHSVLSSVPQEKANEKKLNAPNNKQSWSSPERKEALISSPEHLESFVSPLTESSGLSSSSSLELLDGKIAPANHFAPMFSPQNPSSSCDLLTKESTKSPFIYTSPSSMPSKSPMLKRVNQGFPYSTTSPKTPMTPINLKPVDISTLSKQDRLEMFMRFQPAGYQETKVGSDTTYFAQGWYPGAQHWEIFPYNQLVYPGPYPKDVDVRKRECYLSQDEFFLVFKMNRRTFYELPAWKQISLRKTHKLF